MDRKSKILVIVFVIIIFASVFLTYKRSFVDRDFEIDLEANISDLQQ